MSAGYSEIIKQIFDAVERKNWILATAESCTGGLISAAITAESGSSTYFDRGFVTYSNNAKLDLLNVSHETLSQYGAVSEQTAVEMAQGALNNSNANIAVSVTGIAGPTGGTADKPVGLVYIGCALADTVSAQAYNFPNMSRDEVRHNTVKAALDLILSRSRL